MDAGAIDDVDTRIAAALQVNGRASWGLIARVLDLPERTVVRRGQALFDRGLVRVSTYVDVFRVLHAHATVLRVRTRRDSLWDVAAAISARDDASSVSVLEGGDDLACMVLPRDDEARERLHFRDMAQIPGIDSVAMSTVLRFYRSGHDWRAPVLSDAECRLLDPPTLPRVDPDDSITESEAALIELLVTDGRLSITRLSERSGLSPATVRRRMESLKERGLMRARTEVAPSVFGLHAEALVWLRVPMELLDVVGEELAGAAEAKFVAAVTGRSQLLVNVLARDERELLAFLSGSRLSRHSGLEVEESRLVVAPVLRGALHLESVPSYA